MNKFTDEQYKAWEYRTAYLEDMNAHVVTYNETYRTAFKSQFEMIHVLYVQDELSAAKIARFFDTYTTKDMVLSRLKKMGIQPRPRGGRKLDYRTVKFNGQDVPVAHLARWYDIHICTLWRRIELRWDLQKALTKPIKRSYDQYGNKRNRTT